MTSKFRVSIILAASFMALAVFFLLGLPSQPDSLAQTKEASDDNNSPVSPFVSRQAVAFGESVAVRDLPASGIATTQKGYKFDTIEDKMEELRIERENQERVMKGLPPLTERQREDREKNSMNTERVKKGLPGFGNAGKGSFLDEALAPAAPSVMPVPTVNFDGLASTDNTAVIGTTFAPPDTVGDVGPNHYVQMDNTLVRIYNKAGVPLAAPFLLSSITGVAGGPCATANDGDPIVVYDPLADRWILSQFCVTPVPGHQIFAVSKTPDPTGAYFVYDFVLPNINFQDYPHIGVWPSGYFMSTNQFNQAGTAFLGAGAFAFDRTKMVSGDPTASYIYVDEFGSICPSCGGQLPTDIDGTVPPSDGSFNLFMEFRADEFGDPADALRIFAFRPNYTTPASSTFTQVGTDLTLAPFDANSPTSRSAIEQPGTTQGLDAIADRLMHRLAYRNLGTVASPVNSYLLNFTVNVGGGAATSAATYQTGIRWVELRRASGVMTVNQQGTQSTNPGNPAGGTNLWMGSIAQDAVGDIVLGYNTSGSTNAADFPSIKYAGRLAGDPAGQLSQGEGIGILGTGFQNGAGNRWGDYSSASVDPADECSFWYTTEYRTAAQNASPFRWNTRIIGGIKFPGCTTPQRGTISGVITSCSNGLPIAGATVTSTGGFVNPTNASGQYTIINVPVGTTGVAATKASGFNTATNNAVVVTNGGNSTTNLCLTGVPVLSGGTATLVSESCLPANGVVDPGETVTLAFPVSNTGGANTTADIGTLQTGGGVTAPGAAQNYGVINAGGAAVTRNFTFTANSAMTCGTNITATVAHLDGANNLGNVVYTIPTGLNGAPGTTSYTSPTVAIPDNVPAGVNVPLVVSGVTGAIADLNFRIDGTATSSDPVSTTVGLNHSWVGDIKFKLTSPANTTVEIMTAGGGATSCSVNNIFNMTLDDQSANAQACPAGGTNVGPLTGSFLPSNPLSAFNGQNPNGTWTLNVSDNAVIDTGSIRAYSLIITPKTCSNCNAAAPTVTTNFANQAQNSPTIVINGTNFSTTPANNTVAFNLGAAGNVTAATATQLTVTFTAQPNATGPLTAVVTSNGVNSGAPVQVASIVAAPTPTLTPTPTPTPTPAPSPTPGSCATSPVIYAYSEINNHLITFNAASPGVITSDIPLTGLNNTTEVLIGIDFRPATGQLYSIASDGTTDRVVTIDPTTGAVTNVGGTRPSLADLFYGFDFNPVVDRLRVIGFSGSNRRFNPNDGTLAATDTNLAYAPGDPGAGTSPNVVHIAYDRNNPGNPVTTLFGIDSFRDTLVRVGGVDGNPSPNGGQLFTVGPLGFNASSFGGFDIQGGSNNAYAVIRTPGVSSLYTINLTTGTATLVGAVGGGPIVDGIAVGPCVIPCVPTPNVLLDPSLEASVSGAIITNPFWQSTSSTYLSSICSTAFCGNGGGTAVPRTGTYFAWFGGSPTAELDSLQQTVTIPNGSSPTLKFWLRIGSVTAPFDATMVVKIDGQTIQTFTEPAVAESDYTERTVIFPSSFANGAPHTVRFEYTNPAGSGPSNFTVDDITMSVGCPLPSCNQNFDTVTAPALPAYWTAQTTVGALPPWVTSTTNPDTAPNDAFATDIATISNTELVSPNFVVAPGGTQVTFRNLFNLEASATAPPAGAGFDGMVLEISINGAPFQDILVAGGSFVTGGYNRTISTLFGSPIAGRQAWSGLSAGTTAAPAYITTTVNLPVAATGQLVKLKWRVATDSNGIAAGQVGARIDTITGIACTATAAGVQLSGRVMTPDGRGLRNARVTMTDQSGGTHTVTTSSFGYYEFNEVEAGQTYILSVTSRTFRFTPQILQVTDSLADVDFIGID